MGTEIFIDEELSRDITRILYMIKTQSSDEREQLEKALSEMSEDELASIDESSRFEKCSELYHLGTLSGKHYPTDARSVEDMQARAKRKFFLHVPKWFLEELDPNVTLHTLGADYGIDTIRDLMDKTHIEYMTTDST
jgi:hypothetical protein